MPTASPGLRSTSPARPPTCWATRCSRSSTRSWSGSRRDPPRGVVIRSGKANGFIAGADIKRIHQLHERRPTRYALIRARPARVRPHRSAALPHRRRHSRLRARRRPRARAGLPLSRGRGRRAAVARAAGSAARHSPGLRRHGARGAAARRAPGDGADAHGQAGARRQGAAAGARRPPGYRGRHRAAARARAHQQAAAAASAAVLGAAAELAHRALVREARAHRAGGAARLAASTTRRPTPSSICGRSTARAAQQAYEAEARSIAHLFTTETARNLVRVFLLQDRLKALGGKGSPPVKPRARGRRRRHGRRHRRLVRAARPRRSRCRIAASNTSSRRSSARTSCSRSALKDPAQTCGRAQRACAPDVDGDGRAGCRRGHRGDLREPRSQAARCTRSSSRA